MVAVVSNRPTVERNGRFGASVSATWPPIRIHNGQARGLRVMLAAIIPPIAPKIG
jgi:hypothetical protein